MFAFVGAARLTLDDKSRVSLPRKAFEQIREAKEGEGAAAFHMTASPDGCLLFLDTQALQEVIGPYTQSILGSSRDRVARRLLLGHAEEVSLDSAGRVVISDGLKTYSGIQPNEQVFVVGQGRYLEVWSADRWKAWVADTRLIRELFDETTSPASGRIATAS